MIVGFILRFTRKKKFKASMKGKSNSSGEYPTGRITFTLGLGNKSP